MTAPGAPVRKGDTFLWMGCVARATRVADDETWADLLVVQQPDGAVWTKRQPLPLPTDAVRYEGHPFPPVTFTESGS